MPDRSEDLSTTLASLHEALESADSLDPRHREELRKALDEIQELLGAEDGSDSHRSLLERLSKLTAHFEEEHPALTEAIGRVVHALGQLGI